MPKGIDVSEKKKDDDAVKTQAERDNRVTRREILKKLAYIPPVVTSLLLSRNVMAGQSCPGECPAQCAPLCRPVCTPVCTPVH
jgi:hypothetical protein